MRAREPLDYRSPLSCRGKMTSHRIDALATSSVFQVRRALGGDGRGEGEGDGRGGAGKGVGGGVGGGEKKAGAMSARKVDASMDTWRG